MGNSLEKSVGTTGEKLEELAKALIEKETMDGRDVERLIRGEIATENSKEKDNSEQTAEGENA